MYKSRVVGLEDSLKERTKTAVAHVPPKDWFGMSEVEKWQHSIDVWEREKWKMLRKYLTPEQLEAVKNVNGIVKKMRYGLKEELDEEHIQAMIDATEQAWEDGYHSARRYYNAD
tara:strand:+ start:250 stop:591 length:342 start_codon:yes stop_codon:yes gene_type:complete